MRVVRAVALSMSGMLFVASTTSAAILRVPQNHTTIGAAIHIEVSQRLILLPVVAHAESPAHLGLNLQEVEVAVSGRAGLVWPLGHGCPAISVRQGFER